MTTRLCRIGIYLLLFFTFLTLSLNASASRKRFNFYFVQGDAPSNYSIKAGSCGAWGVCSTSAPKGKLSNLPKKKSCRTPLGHGPAGKVACDINLVNTTGDPVYTGFTNLHSCGRAKFGSSGSTEYYTVTININGCSIKSGKPSSE